MAKLNLPKLEFDKKKAGIAGGVIVLAVAGWLAWDMFMAEPPPPPPPPVAAKPPAPKPPAVSPDKLVDDLVKVSGLDKQIELIPEKISQGMNMSSAKPRDPALVAEVGKIMAEAFKPERIQNQVREVLKKDFERKRVEGLIKAMNAPLMKKMFELEAKEVKPEELAAFAKGLSRSPLAKERLQALQDYDRVTRSSEFATEMVTATTRSMVAGAVGGDAAQLAKFDAEFGKQKDKLATAVRDATMLSLAYMYRDVSDAELAEYGGFYATEDGKWFVDKAMGALLEEFRAGAQQAGERIVAMAKAARPAAAGKAAKSAGGETVAQAPAPSAARPLTARSKLDARECLKHDSNQAIHRCAEGFR
jgi:hypothetical protein